MVMKKGEDEENIIKDGDYERERWRKITKTKTKNLKRLEK